MSIMSSPRLDLNQRPTVYKTVALPLSYKGGWVSSVRHPQKTLSAKNTKPYSSCFSGNFQIGWEFPPEVCLAFLFWKTQTFPDLPTPRVGHDPTTSVLTALCSTNWAIGEWWGKCDISHKDITGTYPRLLPAFWFIFPVQSSKRPV